jgi:hypothetical protein
MDQIQSHFHSSEPEAAPFDFIQRTARNPNYKFFKALCAGSSAVANFIK